MASKLSNEEHVRPGHLDLQLNASSVQGQYQISHNIAVMDKILRDFRCNDCRFNLEPFERCEICQYVVTCNAILNLKGAFFYYQKQYIEACKQFDQVLETDWKNQNALINLYHVYQKLGDWQKANEYFERYKSCIDDKKGEATFLGEQGFAILFDCHTKTNELERYRRSVTMFEESLQISEKLLGEEDKQDFEDQKRSDWELDLLQWKLWYAQSLQRMSNACRPAIDKGCIEHCYEEGLKTLQYIIKALKHSKHNHLISIAYTYLGIFMSKNKWNGLKKFSEKYDLQREFDDPYLCFVKALKIQRNTEALIRYALSLKFKDICRAIRCITEALEIDKSADGNWFAWSVSSDLHVYHVEKRKYVNGFELLKLAIEHGEKGASKNTTVNLSVTLGKAYHYLARDHTLDETEKRKLYLKSLEHFLHALQHLDGDKQDSVHISHGKCLFDMGQYRPALESFKRAVELGLDAGIKISYSFSSMMKCYMKVLEKESNEQEKCHLLEIISYWLDVGVTKEDLVKQCNTQKKSTTSMDQRNSFMSQEKQRERSRSFTSVVDIPSKRNRGDHMGMPDEYKGSPVNKATVNFEISDDQTGPVGSLNRNIENRLSHDQIDGNNCMKSEKVGFYGKLQRQRSRSETLYTFDDGKELGHNVTSDTTLCENTDQQDYMVTVVVSECKNDVKEKCPDNNIKYTVDNDSIQRNDCPCRKKLMDEKMSCESQKEFSDWQTISPTALLQVIKFLISKKKDKVDKLLSWCLSSEKLKSFQHIVLDIFLLIVPLKNRALIENCLKHLYDQSHLSTPERNKDKMDIENLSPYHMDEYHRYWYIDEISKRLIEIQCKRCKDSKLWKEDCGHGLNHVALYCMIATYCPSLAVEIAAHLMTRDVRFAQVLLEAFQKKCISYASYDENCIPGDRYDIDEFIEQHVMTCIFDLHYQACWLRTDRILVQRLLNHERLYRNGRHTQYQRALNRCLSVREDREDALYQLIRISTFDEDSHMKLVEWQNKRDTIYFNYCEAESGSIHSAKTYVKNKPPKRRFPKYEYDFLVINSDEDSDWVRFELLPTLEERYGFKGCFKMRDFMPGTTVLKEFENKVKESSKVILVLTEKFKNDDLCSFQMHSALMKKLFVGSGKIIPLVAGSGDKQAIYKNIIPEELQHIVCFFVNRFDWERLVRAIEDE
ncbi:hypothetical protein ACJMK2_042452 [Sinanodonta woodiana]|uniref:TIR domain-containing protein n=1 Tax=Sinanodonta woodiana TaxID=1069815 RepID=A0ABD3W7G6_SINWO